MSNSCRGRQDGCLLDALLLSEDEEGRRMSDAGVRDELMTLLIAGQVCNLRRLMRVSTSACSQHRCVARCFDDVVGCAQETSAILLGWCTAFLAHEPEVRLCHCREDYHLHSALRLGRTLLYAYVL